MADWIKMRVDLYRDPKVIVMADSLLSKDGDLARYVNQNTQRDMSVTRNVMRNVTVGALVSIWGVARKQGKRSSECLVLPDVTLSVLDDIAELPGVGEAMEDAGWVQQTEEGLVFPRFFEEHNTDYEAHRAKNRERQARYRAKKEAEKEAEKRNVTVTLCNASKRESKSKSIKPPIVPQGTERAFDQFWQAVHIKTGKEAARRAFTRAVKRMQHEGIQKGDAEVRLLDRMAAFARSPQAHPKDRSPIHPATWLNQGRYDDDPAAWEGNGHEVNDTQPFDN
jgi:hypothetical protein